MQKKKEKITIDRKHYSYLWKLIHKLEMELIYRELSIRDLDCIRDEDRNEEEKMKDIQEIIDNLIYEIDENDELSEKEKDCQGVFGSPS